MFEDQIEIEDFARARRGHVQRGPSKAAKQDAIKFDVDLGHQQPQPGLGIVVNFTTQQLADTVPTLLTRASFLHGAETVIFHLSSARLLGVGKIEYALGLPTFEPIEHPDEEQDLAVVPLISAIDRMIDGAWAPTWKAFSPAWIPTATDFYDLTAGRLEVIHGREASKIAKADRLPLEAFQPLIERYAADN